MLLVWFVTSAGGAVDSMMRMERAGRDANIRPNYVSWTNNKLYGPRLNIKTVLSTYGDFHVKDKTAVRTSYL